MVLFAIPSLTSWIFTPHWFYTFLIYSFYWHQPSETWKKVDIQVSIIVSYTSWWNADLAQEDEKFFEGSSASSRFGSRRVVVPCSGIKNADASVGKVYRVPTAPVVHTTTPIAADPGGVFSPYTLSTQIMPGLASFVTVTAPLDPTIGSSSIPSPTPPVTSLEINPDATLPPYTELAPISGHMALNTTDTEHQTAPPLYSIESQSSNQNPVQVSTANNPQPSTHSMLVSMATNPQLSMHPALASMATHPQPSTHPAAQGVTAQPFVLMNTPTNIHCHGAYFPPGSVPRF
ncbi:hypothetical protein ARMSODRAFT_1023015 [Armillaria solidipes]|uniref:Uncharacterized protein n=1 Tax=Armillaria solidipes TaxID=1076256 RepID=A0A2H3BLL0_9AGAR|nr:hypothetical protein ARMSODRAFT_1023015 [Armillaria solidipes]